MSDEHFIKLAIDELEKIGIIDKEDVLDSTRIKVKKAYPAYFGTYSEFDKVREYLDSFDNLYCIGRNGQHRYNNMDHSMLTAIEAVKAIKNNSTKEDIWNVNIEKDYHEEKEK
jgi:protoporphyrinogen oxidase